MKLMNVYVVLCYLFCVGCTDDKGKFLPVIQSFNVKVDKQWIKGTIDQDSREIFLYGISDGKLIEDVEYELSPETTIYPAPEYKLNDWGVQENFQIVSAKCQKITYSVFLPDYIPEPQIDNPELIAPEKIVGVICKTAQEDQDISLFVPDVMLGAPTSEFVLLLNSLSPDINVICIPIAKSIFENRDAGIIIDFLEKLHAVGKTDLKFILCLRKWDLHLEEAQQSWAEQIAYTFNQLKSKEMHKYVIGCMFDENRSLKGEQSNVELWNNRHRGVLGALDKLNSMTDNAFKKRVVFIHGKGYGSQFKGVKESSKMLNFKEKMLKRCLDYAYNFKYFETGVPTDKSLNGWRKHFKEYCSLDEVKELNVPLIFVGDAGDGLRGNSFIGNPYGGTSGKWVIPALRDVFKEYGWSGFSFGFCFSPVGGETIFTKVIDGHIEINKQVILDSWRMWYDTTRLDNNLQN